MTLYQMITILIRTIIQGLQLLPQLLNLLAYIERAYLRFLLHLTTFIKTRFWVLRQYLILG